jgi:hypothetical protein
MYNIPSLNMIRYDVLVRSLADKGTWTLGCCRAIVPVEQVVFSNYCTRARAKCLLCVTGYDTWGPNKEGLIQYSGSKEYGYQNRELSWGGPKITAQQIIDKHSVEGGVVSPIYDDHEVFWSEQSQYDTVNNILEQLKGDSCGDAALRDRREFADMEVDFLKEHNLLEQFQEVMLIVQCNALRMTQMSFKEIQTRMTSAGQCLGGGWF